MFKASFESDRSRAVSRREVRGETRSAGFEGLRSARMSGGHGSRREPWQVWRTDRVGDFLASATRRPTSADAQMLCSWGTATPSLCQGEATAQAIFQALIWLKFLGRLTRREPQAGNRALHGKQSLWRDGERLRRSIV